MHPRKPFEPAFVPVPRRPRRLDRLTCRPRSDPGGQCAVLGDVYHDRKAIAELGMVLDFEAVLVVERDVTREPDGTYRLGEARSEARTEIKLPAVVRCYRCGELRSVEWNRGRARWRVVRTPPS
jgi:hypothetical protein